MLGTASQMQILENLAIAVKIFKSSVFNPICNTTATIILYIIEMARSLGIDTDHMKLLGLMISNGLVGLSGGLNAFLIH